MIFVIEWKAGERKRSNEGKGVLTATNVLGPGRVQYGAELEVRIFAYEVTVGDANQEEVYIPLEGSGLLHADDQVFELRPGMMARVGPEQMRRIVPGDQGIRFIALGAVPGTFDPSPWSELGGPPPVPPESV